MKCGSCGWNNGPPCPFLKDQLANYLGNCRCWEPSQYDDAPRFISALPAKKKSPKFTETFFNPSGVDVFVEKDSQTVSREDHEKCFNCRCFRVENEECSIFPYNKDWDYAKKCNSYRLKKQE